MATTETTVTGRYLDLSGTAVASAYLTFRLLDIGADDGVTPKEVFARNAVSVQTNASGDFSTTLWTNGDSDVDSVYEVKFPDGRTKQFIIPTATATIDLATLLALHQPASSTQQSVIQGNLDAFAANPTVNASFSATTWRSGLNVESGATADQTGAEIKALYEAEADTNAFDDAAVAKLAGISAGGEVNDPTTLLDADIGSTVQAYDADLTTLGAGGSAARSFLAYTIPNVIFVSKGGTDTRTGLDPHDIGNPFLTCTAALAAASIGDTIHVFAGDYTAEDDLEGKDGVNWTIEEGALSPSFSVDGAFTFTIDGDIGGSFTVSNTSANVTCNGDVATLIGCEGGTQTAGNAGTYIYCTGGTQTAGNAGTYIECYGGAQTVGNAGTSIYCESGTQTAGNAGTSILCGGGTQTIRDANISHDGTSHAPIYLYGSGSLTVTNSRIESTEVGGKVVDVAASWSGTFVAKNCDFVNTTASSIGISYGATVTGDVQLKDCTIITGAGGKSVDAPSAQTVYIQGSLSQTHAVDADITLTGGATYTNTNYTA